MAIVLIVLVLSFIVWWMRLPVFEVVFGVLLLAPIAVFPLVRTGTVPPALYGGALLVLLVVLAFLARGRSGVPRGDPTESFESVGVFLVLFLFNYSLCLLWPDFIAMGERLRDYAILASVYNSPVVPREPWLSDAVLNYYLYWYRFGHLLAALGRLEIWDLYHQLQAFTFALFGASVFHLLRRIERIRPEIALLLALVVAYGSNLAGVGSFLRHDTNWWGPSRVIPGAINEFPAWSFLLGDLHPHFLNLCLAPFLCCIGVALLRLGGVVGAGGGIVLFAVAPLWFFNANAWEVPIWIGWSALACVFLGGLVVSRDFAQTLRGRVGIALRSGRVWVILLVGAYIGFSLYLSSRNIAPGDTPLRLVRDPIARTDLWDLFRHWGAPLSIIAVGLLILRSPGSDRRLAALMVGCTILSSEALPFLGALTVLAGWRCLDSIVRIRRAGVPEGMERLLIHAFGFGALVLLMLPEVVFLDDPYGGENERMNTIFKVYAATWFAVHLYAVSVLAECFRRSGWRRASRRVGVGLVTVVVVVLCGFFLQTVEVRKTRERGVNPVSEGLSELEKRFPGAAGTIQGLVALPRGVVLEAQGPAYDYTTHVATLSGNEAFLGWANHVNLLIRAYDEVAHRERATKDFYTVWECAAKREFLRHEAIGYAVLGPLERKAYPGIDPDSFGCLRTVLERGEYRVLAP